MATTYPVYPATTFTQAVELTIFASNQLHDVINGDALTTVETENGDVPTLRKALVDNFYFKTPVAWVAGETSTVFNQLYYYDGSTLLSGWYYAPQATDDNPIPMGASPEDDDNWRLYQTATQSIPAQVYPWSTDITTTTSSIAPPYEFDTAIVVFNGIVLVPGIDRDYTISDSVITFNTPLEPEPNAEYTDVLFCYIGKVEEGNAETNYVTYTSLGSQTAAGLIGTTQGLTIQDQIDKSVLGFNSYNDLKNYVPRFSGQKVKLMSYFTGWSATTTGPVGGGTFIAKSGSAIDDGGYICVPTGQASYYWERLLGPDEYLTPQMYGYTTGYDSSLGTGVELKPYIQAAIDKSIDINKAIVYLPEADYFTAIGNIELAGTGHNRAVGVKVQGHRGAHTTGGTRIYFNAPASNTPLFLSQSPSSLRTSHGIDDLWLEATSANLYNGYALKLVGTCFMVSERIHVERMYDGVHLLNTRSLTTDGNAGDKNGYCEFDTFRDWTINKCRHNVSFNNDGTGDASMHGVRFDNMFSQLKEDGDGIYFNGTSGGLLWYNSPGNTIKFWGGAATGTNTCQLLRIEGTEVRGVGGGMSWEGFGRITCDGSSYFRFDGDIFGLPGNKALIDYSGVLNENSLCDARVIFNNTTSRDTKNMSNTIMSPYYFRPIPPISRGAKNNTNYAIAMPIRITTSATEKPTLNTEYEGLAFPTFHNGDIWFGEVVSQSVWYGMIPTLKYNGSSGDFTNYTSGITFNIKDTSGNDAGTNIGWEMSNHFYPQTTLTGSIGLTTNRLSAVYANGGQITTSGIFPRTTAAYDLGSSTATWNNIYAQNAVTVVSDSNLKPIQESLTEEEISVANSCSKLFIKYKLAAAISEKGEASARYHFGVIAQAIASEFEKGGLNAEQYGVIATSIVTQKVNSLDGKYVPIEDENGEIHIPAEEDGFILVNESMDSVTISDDQTYMLTRKTLLIRYEELLCFINAGIIQRLELLESSLKL